MASITPETKLIVLAALHSYHCDDYERAKSAFRSCTDEQMQQQYGESGKTRQQILDSYKAHADAVDRAIAEVVSL